MSDLYDSYADLAAGEAEGIHYRIRVIDRASPIAVVAPHGGRIEAGTSQTAALIAADIFSLYCFEGLVAGRRLHITSARFDEPRALALVESCRHRHWGARTRRSRRPSDHLVGRLACKSARRDRRRVGARRVQDIDRPPHAGKGPRQHLQQGAFARGGSTRTADVAKKCFPQRPVRSPSLRLRGARYDSEGNRPWLISWRTHGTQRSPADHGHSDQHGMQEQHRHIGQRSNSERDAIGAREG